MVLLAPPHLSEKMACSTENNPGHCRPSRTIRGNAVNEGIVHDDLMSASHDVITPAELGRELGHNDGDRPGITVRRYLRERYPDHLKNQRWELTPEQADEVRAHFGRTSA
ncbi:Uncharacterised protein [Mycobacterium tuberculosis]|nr:Uncharacterised protein [Mycobacterium tuberculosis]